MSRGRDCTVHHHACDCREERFAELAAERDKLLIEVGALRLEVLKLKAIIVMDTEKLVEMIVKR